MRATKRMLALLVLAALGGSIELEHSGLDLAAAISVAAFVLAGSVKLYVGATKPEQDWYDGRALAESVKTLAWRYAVGGKPFPTALGSDVDHLFIERIRSLRGSFAHRLSI